MGPPPVTVYLTTIASQPALRKRQEYLLRILQAKRIPFSSYDLASDEDAKRLWRRKAPAGKEQLPGILVGGRFVGTFQQFEEAVEFDELNIFLKRNEEWDEAIEAPSLPEKPIGVPGAHTPMQMTPERIRAQVVAGQPSPLRKTPVPTPINKEPEGLRMDVGDELGGFGLEGVKVTQDELRDLVSQLGLGGDDAEDLISGLGESSGKERTSSSSRKEPKSVKPSAIVQAQPKPLAPLRPKSSKASSLRKEVLNDSTPAPPVPTPKVEEVPAMDVAPSASKVIKESPVQLEPTPEVPSLAPVVEQTPIIETAPEPAATPTPTVQESVVVTDDSIPADTNPDVAPGKEDSPKGLPPITVQEKVNRMPTNRSDETLAADYEAPASNDGVPYSPLTPMTPRTLVAGPETSKLLYKSTEPLSTPTVSEGFPEKSGEAKEKESQGFKAMLRRLFCM